MSIRKGTPTCRAGEVGGLSLVLKSPVRPIALVATMMQKVLNVAAHDVLATDQASSERLGEEAGGIRYPQYQCGDEAPQHQRTTMRSLPQYRVRQCGPQHL